MIPGEYLLEAADIEINAHRSPVTLLVTNTGDRPIQVGSHFPFFEVNRALAFDRAAAVRRCSSPWIRRNTTCSERP